MAKKEKRNGKNNKVTEKDRRRVVRNTAVQNTQYKFFSVTKNISTTTKILLSVCRKTTAIYNGLKKITLGEQK